MTNKFIAIILSVLFIFSIGPAPLIFAEDGVASIFDVNLESWTVGTKYNEGYTVTSANYGVADDAGASRFTVGSYFSGELVSLKDSNGSDTKAFKLVSKEISDLNVGQGRFNFVPASPISLQDKVYVQQFGVYVPESDSIGSFNLGTIGKSGKNLNLRYLNNSGDIKNKTVSTLSTGWNEITSVQVGSDGKNIIFFHNGKTLSYKEYGNSTATNRMQFTGSAQDGQYLIFDNFKVYEGAAVTSVSSVYSNLTEVKRNCVLTADFSNMLIDTEINGSDSLCASNAEITNLSDGTKHTVSGLTLTNYGKTVNIKAAAPFNYATKYRVRLTGLRDMHDNIVPDYSFEFTTVPQPYIEASEPEFFDDGIENKGQGSDKITSLENGHIRAAYSITNNHETDTKEVIMFAIVRDGRKLSSIEFRMISLKPGTTEKFNVGFKIDDYENQSVETYIWDSFTGKTALSPSYTISSQGISTTSVE